MKIETFEQGSVEWALRRCHIPTASAYPRILTEKTFKPSAGRDLYCAELVASYILGQPLDWGDTQWTERGTEMEEEAADWYAFTEGVELEKVGFITRDDGETGGSPDRLVKDRKKGLEIKCFGAANHMLHLLDNPLKPPVVPFSQTQGYLYLTGYDSWDILWYNPELSKKIITVEPDLKWQAAFVPCLNEFIERLNREKKRWEHLRSYHPQSREMAALIDAANKPNQPAT